jgi:hypothetical protein
MAFHIDTRREDWTPHAHSANWSPCGKYLFVCEKGTDRIIVYAFDAAAGTITNHSETMVTIGRTLCFNTKNPPVFLFQLSFVLSRACVWHDVITHNNIGLTKGGVSVSHRRRRAASCSAPGRPARLLQRGGGRQDHLLRLGRRHGHAHPKAVAPNSAGKWQIEHLNLSLVLTITDRQLVGAGFERVLSSEILCFSCFDKRACSVACTGRVL